MARGWLHLHRCLECYIGWKSISLWLQISQK